MPGRVAYVLITVSVAERSFSESIVFKNVFSLSSHINGIF